MTFLGICNYLHMPWYGLIEDIKVFCSDALPDFVCNLFVSLSRYCLLFSMYIFHLTPQIFNRIQIWQVPVPASEQFQALALVPLHEIIKAHSNYVFFAFCKSGKFLLPSITSRQIALESCATTQIKKDAA